MMKKLTKRQKQVINDIIFKVTNDLIGGTLKPEHHFVNDLGYDSLDQIELLMTLEREYGMRIPDHLAEEVETVQDLYDLLSELM
jgi:acyl carrier protein